ncbi:MAG: TIR domain-containing protein [Chloroflexi bacterium]|nr:TIR domain-containing protein [Chloroflexota bacterium]
MPFCENALMRIFVSYSSRNRPQVTALVQDLENTGHDVWYDQEAAGGHEWWADILDNIRACELFIFALTPESLDSEACRREYRYAHALHKRILPVRLSKAVNPASLTIELQKINFVDYFSGAEQEYRQLVRGITSLKPPVPMPDPMPDEPPVPISPLGELREKIAARSIGVETQTYLVFELKQHVEKAATRAEALELLQRLQNHRDLRIGVANEITQIIAPYIVDESIGTALQSFLGRFIQGLTLILVVFASLIAIYAFVTGEYSLNGKNGTDEQDRTEVSLDLTDTPTTTPSPTNEASATNTTIATPSLTDEPTAAPTQTSTSTNTPLSTASATNTPSQTTTMTPTANSTQPSGLEAVTSNAQWKEMGGPIEQEFDGVMMVLAPAGCFDMGSIKEQLDYAVSLGATSQDIQSETPVTQICFDEPFWMDKFEVTQGDFERLGGVAGNESYFVDDRRPREQITWFEARDFCKQKRDGRLPTEAEWEYTARGPDNLIFPWGNEFELANVVSGANSNSQTAEVGSKKGGVSWLGAYDMSGNVWEWVSSLGYGYDSELDREDDSNNIGSRVMRGGSWNDTGYANNVRSANRDWTYPGYSVSIVGFRCARDYNGEPIQLSQ